MKQDELLTADREDSHSYSSHSYSSLEKFPERIRSAPLSYSQLQMWVINRMQPGNHAYNLSVGFLFSGKVNVPLLEHCFNEIIKRHEILRTTFTQVKEEPIQIIHPGFSLKIKIVEIHDLKEDEKEIQAVELASNQAIKSFDLTSLPLIRVMLIITGKESCRLVISMHHIIADGWSLRLLFKELSVLYNSGYTASELPNLPIQYSDFVEWQKKKEWKPSYNEQLNFWKKQLEGELPEIELPADKTRPAVQSLQGSNLFFFLPNTLTQKLQSAGFRRGSTFFMTILAAFQVFLKRYNCGDEIILGTPVSNRPRPADENVIGNFLNTLSIRGDLSGDPVFSEFLVQVRKRTIEALTNRDLPFEKIVEHLKIRRDPSRNPVFQVMLQVLPKYSFELEGLQISGFNFDLGYSQFDLSLHLYETEAGYQCRLEYDTALFETETIRRMSDNFVFFLSCLAENFDLKLSQIPLITESERNKFLYEWNDTDVELPGNLTIIDLFEKQVQSNQNNPAVVSGKSVLSYNELNKRSNYIANYLLGLNVIPGTLIGVCVERSEEMVESLLGILKTGAAYLPLDPSFPTDRLEYIVKDAGISILITQEHLKNLFNHWEGKLISIDKDFENQQNRNDKNPGLVIDQSGPAYSIYTSGSSGNPKGVLIQHSAVVNFLLSMQKKPGISDRDILLAVTTISFDISVLEIFLPLISGAKVIIAGKMDVVDGSILLDVLKRGGVTIMQATPSTWRIMIESGWIKTPGLKMLCGGESLPGDLALQMIERGAELWNMYGPTETTVWSSVLKIEKDDGQIFIGPPIDNTQFYVVDNYFNPVPIGVAGELLIGGKGLAKGYLNRPELTSERFIKNPFSENASRLYRTGDLVRYHPDGKIEFLGRTDFQVKLRGYRIEPGEIENILSQHELIKDCVVVVVQKGSSGDKQLAAYYISNNGEADPGVLRSYLKQKLPEYMIPSVFVRMEEFPLTPNRKINRKALPQPSSVLTENRTIHELPSTGLEIQIAGIWKKILGLDNIGLNENFFELGGHSLLAVQMFAELEKITGIRLPLVTLFEHQDINGLVSVINSGSWKEKWISLIQIKKGTRTPLFMVHGAEGNILIYKDLARHLDVDQPFYALQSRGLDGVENVSTSIEDMAAHYITEIKKVQPHGPYILGGYCMGGTIAYEMAQQLTRNGEEVSNIFLIETYNICTAGTIVSNKMSLKDKMENVVFHIDNLRSLNFKGRLQFISNKTDIMKRRVISRLKAAMHAIGFHIDDTLETFRATYKIRDINDRAQTLYIPKEYNGKAVLLKPKVNYSSGPDPDFGWNGLVKGEFKIYTLDIAPRGMLYEPFVLETAEVIKKEL